MKISKPSLVPAESGVQPLWEADEIADEIDRMIEEGGKDSPEQLSLND
jgi:hypothetical protein